MEVFYALYVLLFLEITFNLFSSKFLEAFAFSQRTDLLTRARSLVTMYKWKHFMHFMHFTFHIRFYVKGREYLLLKMSFF